MRGTSRKQWKKKSEHSVVSSGEGSRTLPCFAMSPALFLRRPTSLRSDMVRLGDWVQTFYSSDNPIANGFRELVSETGGTLARPSIAEIQMADKVVWHLNNAGGVL